MNSSPAAAGGRYALAGNVNANLATDSLGKTSTATTCS
jgi:hypothetical protein